ncbi:thioredoxin family protein [Stratiformator vulcanicus]|nr:thioredoxin family protein [Stratiformator vulcanicus]
MHRLPYVAVIAMSFVVVAAAVSKTSYAADPSTEIAWRKDIYEAQADALKTGRPMLLVFGANWCTFCKKFERATLSNSTMSGYVGEKFVPVHLDYDADRRIADILEVKQIPCTVILSPEADLLGRVVGNKSPRDYWERLEDARDLHSEIKQVGHQTPTRR